MVQKKMPVRESSYEDYADFEGVEELQEARWEIEGRVSYRGIGSEDSFHMVIDAPNESAAERKVEKELDKARDRRKISQVAAVVLKILTLKILKELLINYHHQKHSVE